MNILYVFPHPDDESFGPARAMAAQIREGHAVSLLTLTRGGATRERHKLGYTVDEMSAVRAAEMREVASVLGLTDLTVLDLPDSGLKEMDPRILETMIADQITHKEPQILVTYPVHGISGFHDHLVTHAVVKRVYEEMRGQRASSLQRLAFFTLTVEQAERASGHHRLSGSSEEEIDCLFEASVEDMAQWRHALDCYRTYREMIEATGIKTSLDALCAFEFYRERFRPPVSRLESGL
jgi:N-acetylglucosamine malate deacetylase 2